MAGVDEAVAAIRAGEAVILPTDTVYGLCAAPDDEAAIERVYRLKGRPEGMPIALLFPDVVTLLERVPELPQRVRALLPRRVHVRRAARGRDDRRPRSRAARPGA